MDATYPKSLEILQGKSLTKFLKGFPVSIVGLGISGISAARCLQEIGANLFLSESSPRSKFPKRLPKILRQAKSEFGRHTHKILRSGLIVLSPGVEWKNPLLELARKRKIPVWSELELGWRLSRPEKVAAVTGTNGKTTVVSLISDMCRRGGFQTLCAGNIGNPLCDFYQSAADYDAGIYEVSSYQLQGIHSFHPQVSVILNLTADHLHRHKSMPAYARAKERVFSNQTKDDFTVLNLDDPWCRKMAKKCRSKILWFSLEENRKSSIFYDQGSARIVSRIGSKKTPQTFPLAQNLPGSHNIANSCAAIASALCLKVPVQSIHEALRRFPGVRHRLEKLPMVDGVTYVNDSKSTNVDSTKRALESFPKSIWLILGGEDKGSPYRPLRRPVRDRVKGIFLIGEAAYRIARELKDCAPLFHSRTLSRAVKDSFLQAERGEIVLLSPGCASFDQFRNFEHRGNSFVKHVKELNKPKRAP